MRYTQATLIWLLIAAMAAVTAVSLLAAGISVDVTANPSTFVAIGTLLVASPLYRAVRPDPHIQGVITALGQMLLILLLGELLTYPAAATNFPYRDAELYLIDQALGFDRQAYLQFFNAHPWLNAVIGIGYLSLLPQFAFLPLILNNQMPRLRTMMLATGLSLLVTIAISVFVPALDAFVYVDITPAAFAKLADQIQSHVPTLEALRSGTLHTIRLERSDGLITFPSFHTVGAWLFIWALWKTPYVRWLGLGLNMALIIATPVFGEHYFIDVIAGTAIAAMSIFVSNRICRRTTQTASPAASPMRSWRRFVPGLPRPGHVR